MLKKILVVHLEFNVPQSQQGRAGSVAVAAHCFCSEKPEDFSEKTKEEKQIKMEDIGGVCVSCLQQCHRMRRDKSYAKLTLDCMMSSPGHSLSNQQVNNIRATLSTPPTAGTFFGHVEVPKSLIWSSIPGNGDVLTIHCHKITQEPLLVAYFSYRPSWLQLRPYARHASFMLQHCNASNVCCAARLRCVSHISCDCVTAPPLISHCSPAG